MDAQTLVQIILTGIPTFGLGVVGYYVSGVRTSIEKLEEADVLLAKELGEVRELVAGKYVTRDEFREEMKALRDDIRAGLSDIAARVGRQQ